MFMDILAAFAAVSTIAGFILELVREVRTRADDVSDSKKLAGRCNYRL